MHPASGLRAVITAPLLTGCPGVRHGFFERRGGTSQGLYASLNVSLGSGDDRRRVIANRARVARALDLEQDRLVTLYQVHSADVVIVRNGAEGATKADGMVTGQPGLGLGVLTADCAPVLLADGEAGIIGAAHAGWGGALRGITDAVTASMVSIGARRERIVAVVGPTIALESYEVGPEFHQRFTDDDIGNGRYFRTARRSGHFHFDLPAYVLHRLWQNGIRHATWTGGDTCLEEERFFSYRRSVLRHEPDYGRQIAVICLV